MNGKPNLVLIGFMATGKTAIGRDCARILGYRFCDTDSYVERRARKSVAAIFSEDGEDAFRAMERAAVRALSAEDGLVIATGGGVPLRSGNVACLRRTGLLVLLVAEPSVIIQRVGDRSARPLLTGVEDVGESVRSLLAVRDPYYRAAAHACVDTAGLERGEVVERVIAAYNAHAVSSP